MIIPYYVLFYWLCLHIADVTDAADSAHWEQIYKNAAMIIFDLFVCVMKKFFC